MKFIELKLEAPRRRRTKKLSDASFVPEIAQGVDFTYLPRTGYDYAASVGDGLGSSVLMSPVKWIQRTFPEADLLVVKEADDQSDVQFDHPLVELVEMPNPFYTGMDLFAGTLYSWIFDGNAYWRKIRGFGRGVSELWYIPHWLIEPKHVRGEFISYYEYRPGGNARNENILPEDIIHFRNGINPRNTRKGMSLVYSELREIFGDDEAANFTSSILKNMGVPGLLFSPDTDEPIEADVEVVKSYLKQQFSRDKRGEPLVTKYRTKVEQFGFDPKSMVISELRDICEERICAALGIPAAVVGFGTGLQQTKVGATMQELSRLAWTGCLIPMQKAFAAKLDHSLLPEFEPNPRQFYSQFDVSDVEVLREAKLSTAQAFDLGIRGGWITVAEGLDAMGLSFTDADKVYLRNINVVPEAASSGAKARSNSVVNFRKRWA